jgi:hypothetical protein
LNRTKKLSVVLLFSIGFYIAQGDVLAKPFFAPGVGLRALGMGGAFIALADDVTAAYWNPAGLPQLSGVRAVASLPFPSKEGLFAIQYYGASVNWSSIGISMILASKTFLENLYPEEHGIFQMAFGSQISSTFRAGASIKRYSRKVGEAFTQGVGFDLGAMIEPFLTGWLSQLTIGAKMADIGGTTLRGVDPTATSSADMHVELGAMWHMYDRRLRFVGAIDIIQHKGLDGIHWGVEAVILEAFAMRFGWNNGEITWGLGLGIKNLFDVEAMLVGNSWTISTELTLFGR